MGNTRGMTRPLATPSVTLAAETEVTGGYEEKRSRFVCYLRRAESEDSARDFVAMVRKRHPDARHHCSAFVVDVPGATPIMRSSDDGEPSGTAGVPMLDQLRGAGLSNVVAVVVRWFGGTKLGTGGLVRAYSTAVEDAVRVARRGALVEILVTPSYTTHVGHDIAGRLEAGVRALGIPIVEVSYAAHVSVRIAVDDDGPAAALLATLTAGAARWERTEPVRIERPLS